MGQGVDSPARKPQLELAPQILYKHFHGISAVSRLTPFIWGCAYDGLFFQTYYVAFENDL